MIRRPGYGDHLAATVDPGIRDRQEDISAPPGFADAIGWLAPLANGHDHWHVTFTVASRDESMATAERLGAVVIASDDTEWTKTALSATRRVRSSRSASSRRRAADDRAAGAPLSFSASCRRLQKLTAG
jgi:hypothetical protein